MKLLVASAPLADRISLRVRIAIVRKTRTRRRFLVS
jgi:hypothetical protein